MGLFLLDIINNSHGQAHEEGRSRLKVRHPLRCFPQEDRQEDGNHTALQVHMHLLRKGDHETQGRRHLVLPRQELPCTVAGGAWTYTPTAAASVRSAIRRLRELKEL